MKRTATTLAVVLSVAATAVGTASASTPKLVLGGSFGHAGKPQLVHGGNARLHSLRHVGAYVRGVKVHC